LIIPTVAILVFAIVLIIVFFKVFHSILKAIGLVVLILLVVGIIVGLVIVSDARKFSDEFSSEYTTYILQDGDEYIAGFEAISFNFTTLKPLDIDILDDRANEESDHIRIFIEKSALNTSTVNFSLFTELNMSIESALRNSNSDYRAHAFMSALVQTMVQEGVLYVFKRTRSGDVSIKPDSLTVRILQLSNIKSLDGLKDSFTIPKMNMSLNKGVLV